MTSIFSHGVSEERVISQFSDFIHSSQFRPKSTLTINADGRIHRYTLATEKSGGKSGAYALHLDGCPAGFVMDWHDSASKITWKYGFSDEEKREYAQQQNNPEAKADAEKKRREAEKKKAEEQKLQEENQRKALRMAIAEYEYSFETYIFGHPYMKKKFVDTDIILPECGIFSTRYDAEMKRITYPVKRVLDKLPGGICKEGELLVPLRNVVTGAFQSLIHIPVKPDKDKGFLKLYYKNTSPIGAAHFLIPERSMNANAVLATEGFTTGIACIVLTEGKYPVYCAGSCNNLIHVCRGLRSRNSKMKICIMADNDKSGLEAAKQCIAAGVADTYKVPPNDNEDFYDYLERKVKH